VITRGQRRFNSTVTELLAEDTNEHQRAIPANAEPG
jgi:hypothetical protein